MNQLSSTKTAIASFVLALAASGCSSSTSPTTTTGGDGGSSGSGAVTFSDVYTNVLEPNGCTTHHAAGQLDSFLDLSTRSAAIGSLVGVKASGPACGTTTDVRVVPGSPSTSLLYQKVSMATPPCGSQMPLNGTPISSAEMQMISDWITAGAADN